MKKIQIVGLVRERRRMLEALKRTGLFEVAKAEDGEDTEIRMDYRRRDELLTKIARVRFGIEFIESSRRDLATALKHNAKLAKKGQVEQADFEATEVKKPLFFCREEIDYDNFQLISTREMEIFEYIERLEACSTALFEMRAEELKLNSFSDQLFPYLGLDIDLEELRDTRHVFFLLGTMPQKERAALAEFLEEFPDAAVFDIADETVLITGHIDDKGKIADGLNRFAFTRCALDFAGKPADKYVETQARIKELYYKRLEILHDADSLVSIERLLKIYFDYLNSELESVNAQSEMMATGKAYVLWGWYPVEAEEDILSAARGVSDAVILETREPLEEEIPPTLTKNHMLVEPYESITNMYSAPSYREKDPNVFVMFFFWLFFGVMVADLGYGLILFALTFIVLKLFKMEKGMKNLVMVICMGGVAAVLMGIITGSVFGFSLTGGKSVPVIGMIDPINDPMPLFVISLGLGIIQLVFGLCLKMVYSFKAGKVLDGIFEAGFDALLLVGITVTVLPMLSMLGVELTVPSVLTTVGLIIIVVALVGMMVGAARKKKGIGSKIASGAGALYGVVNYISDILSYCRLFGLAVAGAVIGMVANELAGILFTMMPGVGHVIGVIVAVFFHAFNMALGVLSAYVHNARLQFVEFFGKFYEGGGRIFLPIGTSTKYVRVLNNTDVKKEKPSKQSKNTTAA